LIVLGEWHHRVGAVAAGWLCPSAALTNAVCLIYDFYLQSRVRLLDFRVTILDLTPSMYALNGSILCQVLLQNISDDINEL
jgi:hypothetical protein